jgi:hypothetical protein
MAAGIDSGLTDPPAAAVAFATPAVLCMAASGTGSDSFPVEVGFVLPDGASYCTLVRPPPQWTHWDPRAERVHRIARAAAVSHGRDVTEVAALLNARLGGRTVYCDGAVPEQAWLTRLFDAARATPAFRLESLRVLLSDREAAFWHVLQRQVTTEMRLQRHRASADAKILQLTLIRLRGPLPTPPGN